MSITSLPGFRDFYPEECAQRNAIFNVWREVATRYGFVEYEGPVLEPLELFTQKSGAEIAGQLYHFVDKGERAVAMRPEMTPTLARMAAARHRDYKKPLKWFSIPQLYRYERMQRGRLREHYQLNCDILGEAGLQADIEIIAVSIDMLRGLGLTDQDFGVRLSDRQYWTEFFIKNGAPEDKWYDLFQAIDKYDRAPRADTEKALGSLAKGVFDALENGGTNARMEAVLAGLEARGLRSYAQPDLTIVRGLAYYTGTVFELFDRKGELRAICGGGRYDDLLGSLGGVPMPAIGFGMGDVVLGELLKEKGLATTSAQTLDAFIAIADDACQPRAMKLLQELRDAGLRVDYALAGGKLGKQFEQAEARGARYAVVIESADPAAPVQLKEMKSRGQRSAAVSELIGLLKR